MMRQLISSKSAAKMLGKSEATLRAWRCVGKGPEYFKIEGSVMYDAADVESYIESNRHVPAVRANAQEAANAL